MTRGVVPRLVALGALAACTALAWWPPVSVVAALAGLPSALLFVAGLRPARRWGGWVALFAVPCLAVGIMNLLAGPAGPAAGLALSAAAVAAFFAGLDWTRRTGGSLR